MASSANDDKYIVQTLKGKLLGTEYISVIDDAKYYCFLGIPYAKPPVKNLRFLPPEPCESWTGIRDATKEGDCCIHFLVTEGKVIGSEDCLYLNVYCPQPPCEIVKPKAVIIHIHCGGNNWGSGGSDFAAPDFIVHHDVIFVTVNFRLHVLGFLNLELPNCAGNMGMKDQVMALRWCKENIQFFGGDPDNITLQGGSSGAANIHFHMLSPLSRGLFHKVILQGGFALSPCWSYQTIHLERAERLATMMGFTGGFNRKRMLRFFKSYSVEELYESVMALRLAIRTEITTFLHFCTFTTSIEAFETNAFLCQSPRDLMYSIEPSIPILAGYTNRDGYFAFVGNPFAGTLEEIIRSNMWMYEMDETTLKYVTNQIEQYYLRGKSMNGQDDVFQELVTLYTDLWYIEWQDIMDFEANCGNIPVYLYLFCYDGTLNLQKLASMSKARKLAGACHADDIFYFTYWKYTSEVGGETAISSARHIVDRVGVLFTNFAKNGTPNSDESGIAHWPRHRPNNPQYLKMGQYFVQRKGQIHGERKVFWREIIKYIKDRENGGRIGEPKTAT